MQYFAVFMPVFAGMDKNLTLQEAYEAGVGIAGKEEMKGLDNIKNASKLLQDCDFINYQGYIEGKHIFKIIE